MSTASQPDFSSEFANLSPAQQADVLSFMRDLKTKSGASGRAVLAGEDRRKAILQLAGSISPEDIALMKAAIEEDCERIDADGW